MPFFVLDEDAETVKLPDTRGDYERGAGSSCLQSVGEWHGDAVRNMTGSHVGSDVQDAAGGVFSSGSAGWWASWGGNGTHGIGSYFFNASRQVPTASENRPRSFGILPCVFVGETGGKRQFKALDRSLED